MKQKLTVKSMLLGAFFAVIIILSAAAATTSNSPTAWEYKIVTKVGMATNYEADLNKLGQEGWELVSDAMANNPGSSELHTFIFKRPRK